MLKRMIGALAARIAANTDGAPSRICSEPPAPAATTTPATPLELENPIFVLKVANPAFWLLPEIQNLLDRAFAGGIPTTAGMAKRGIHRFAGSPFLVPFVARDGERWCALALVVRPMNELQSEPHVFHFFNDGPRQVIEIMAAEISKWTQEQGYSTVLVANRRPGQDDAYQRLFAPLGKFENIGTMYRVHL
ncbi:MAG: hypothetical protein ACR2QC_07730 [Gammaproteobacteria bacterium]